MPPLLSTAMGHRLRRLSSAAGATAVHCHVDLSAVAQERVSSCLRHLVKGGKPVMGVASVAWLVAADERGVRDAAQAGVSTVCVAVAEAGAGAAAVVIARQLSLRPIAMLSPELGAEPGRCAEVAALIGRVGAEAVMLSMGTRAGEPELRALLAPASKHVELQRLLGVRLPPGGARLAPLARDEFGVRHFWTCIAGRSAPRPSDLLKALGVGPPDVNLGALFLAEHVPDAG
jgi:hypothetical protein